MSKKAEAVKLGTAQAKKLAGFSTKSAQIRYLAGLGWARGDIARKLGIRYQHVRNVLIVEVKAAREQV